jgi:hypothetical protein
MSRPSTWLLAHKRDVYSQTGEDGIIETILDTLPQKAQWCVEFGAWDGLFLTNTRHLIESKGYSAVLIEADKDRFGDLRRNYAERRNVLTLNRFVGFGADDNLDRILSTTPIPCDFDVLSIDIDGNDYHVWKAIAHYKPKVVVIEFNPTIPTHLRFVQPADPAVTQGASLLSLVELGKEKGYELVAVLPHNALFVRDEYYPLFQMESNAPEVLRTNTDAITYLFSGYDGRVFLRGSCRLPWHGMDLKESQVQPLPRLLQKYPENYSRLERCVFAFHRLVTNPGKLIPGIRRRLRLIGRLRRT